MSDEQAKIILPEYLEIAATLKELELTVDPSEVHGTLCGYISVGGSEHAQAYIQELIENKDVNKFKSQIMVLVNLFQIVFKQMATMSFDFHLLLPDEELPLPERAKSMSLWCHGFSDGFLQSGVDITELKTEEARDALYHITEVSQLDYDGLSIDETDEQSFMELYEYIRMAVLMIHTELTQETPAPTHDDGDKTVH